MSKIILILLLLTGPSIQAAEYISGLKYPESNKTLLSPVSSKALLPGDDSYRGGFNELLPYVVPSIYQDNAGSCLFMSHTAITEVLMNKQFPQKRFDLSERYFMNLQKSGVGEDLIENWRTDTIFRLNATGKQYSNTSYPFTKGHYLLEDGRRVPTDEGTPSANYGVKYNWIDQRDHINGQSISLPKFDREILFADASLNQWNVNVAPDTIVEDLKKALTKRKAPALVIYNHTGFWHAVMVVGFNDQASSDGCQFVSNYQSKMNKRAQEILEEAEQEKDPKTKRKLKRKAAKFQKRGATVNKAYLADGGCHGKGVFYVRDSIYPNKTMPLYDYDPKKEGEEEHLNAPIILREYEWLRYLANHVVQIYVQ